MFEKIIFNELYKYFNENQLLCSNQSGFRPGDSCTNQLLAITHQIFKAFDCNPPLDVRGVFLDISKAFDKVWHEGLLFKLSRYGIKGNLFSLLKSFLTNRDQRVVLNGVSSEWENVLSGVPQGSVLGPLLFLIYINDLPKNLISEVKLFADDTSIFSIVKNSVESQTNLNNDLEKINQWAHQWKMNFNPDPTKQAIQVIFSRKRQPFHHPVINFNDSPVVDAPYQKHLGLFLDCKLDFNHHVKEKISIANRGIGLIKRLRPIIPQGALLNIYKMIIRPNLDYCDVIYDNPLNESFISKLESVQYNAALAITGCIRGSSKSKLFEELGLETLSDRRWFRRLCTFYKILKGTSPQYLQKLIIHRTAHRITRQNVSDIDIFWCRTNHFSASFFPFCSREWNKLSPSIRSTSSISKFKTLLIPFFRPSIKSTYGIHDPLGLKLLFRLRLNLSHLREHKFKYNFQDTLNPLCSCNIETESTEHFLLRCPFFAIPRGILFGSIQAVNSSISLLPSSSFTNTLLYGSPCYSFDENKTILNACITFLKSSHRFDEPLL